MTANSNIRITVTGGGSGVGVQQVGEGLVAIGNTGRALTSGEIEKNGMVSFPFAIDGVAPTQDNAAQGVYLVTRKLYMNTKGKPAGLTEAFVADIHGPDGAGLSQAAGYIPIN